MVDRYGQRNGNEVVIATPLSQHEIAAWAGLSREATVKALHALRALGWITTTPRAISVRDVESVRQRASIQLA
jgi:CRP-like cAMP-binding protein